MNGDLPHPAHRVTPDSVATSSGWPHPCGQVTRLSERMPSAARLVGCRMTEAPQFTVGDGYGKTTNKARWGGGGGEAAGVRVCAPPDMCRTSRLITRHVFLFGTTARGRGKGSASVAVAAGLGSRTALSWLSPRASGQMTPRGPVAGFCPVDKTPSTRYGEGEAMRGLWFNSASGHRAAHGLELLTSGEVGAFRRRRPDDPPRLDRTAPPEISAAVSTVITAWGGRVGARQRGRRPARPGRRGRQVVQRPGQRTRRDSGTRPCRPLRRHVPSTTECGEPAWT